MTKRCGNAMEYVEDGYIDRRQLLTTVGTGGMAGLAGCGGFGSQQKESESERSVQFRVSADGFRREPEQEPISVRGINLGMAKPGTFPGQAAISRDEYDRWIRSMGEIANVVRTYTVHPPAFYRSLAAYNQQTDNTLFLLQGTWVPTADLLEANDARQVSDAVDTEIRRTVDVVHGDITLQDRLGYASGTYDADVSHLLLGYLFGIEWPPEVVIATNETERSPRYNGEYLTTVDGRPFEAWLAERLDRLVAHEVATYQRQHPVSFVNWPTTDPLEHPYEPFRNEDAVSVDPDRIQPTDAFDAGVFASYHVYPYYPDFMNETPAYVSYTDHRGEPNNYAGYLNDLTGHSAHPVLIAEFGVPSSRGIAHRSVHGRHQGRHTEREQGEIVAAMFEDIAQAATIGGVMFAWQNEWFKRTWNLDARSVPGRRPFWSNIETPEQRFGLLAFDPANELALDGSSTGWEDATVMNPAESVRPTSTTPNITAVQVGHDLEGLGFRIIFDELSEPVEWAEFNLIAVVGVTGEETMLPFNTAARAPADFVARLAGPGQSRLLVRSPYDAFAREFGEEAGLPIDNYRDGSAGFVPVREPINRGYTVPATGERVPFQSVETGLLRYGNGNPAAPTYDSLTDVTVSPGQNAIAVKLPWILLNVADPSTKQRIATPWEAGLEKVDFNSVHMGVGTYTPSGRSDAVSTDGQTNLDQAVPAIEGSQLQSQSYAWDGWNQPQYDERLKQSYEVLAEQFGE